MARKVFFSFHFGNDLWRAGQVRNSWITKPDRSSAGFYDKAKWESVRRQSDPYIKRWIRDQMRGTSVTVVLIGSETAHKPYVQYEIRHSWDVDNGLIGIYIHNLKNQQLQTSRQGDDPFKVLGWSNFRTYDWVADNGYNNLGAWVEAAAGRVKGRSK